ncbi:MAG: peptidylprolyl isomerase [Armatimonadetes bacterium]|nr:peptidylprolyl isomerase [Armatimonadota bacterium]
MQTKHGVIYMELWPETAPKTVKAICKLAREKFYDGIVIHRVEPGFVVQFGDPLTKQGGADAPGVGGGGPGFTIPAEFSKTLKHTKGILSMARTQDVNSAGSQMFIMLGDAPFLDGQYSIFGKVLGDAMAQVDKMAVGDGIEYLWVVRDLPEGKR